MPMEEHKQRALLHFLNRSKKPFEFYLDSVAEVVRDLKDSYGSLDPAWRHNDKFLRLMILDGCFMLEILYTFTQKVDDYAHNDPIFSNHGKLYSMPFIKRDMLKLENQLPLLLLNKLVAVENDNAEQDDEEFVTKLILKFFWCPKNISTENCLHLLDVYRKSLLWEPPQNLRSEGNRNVGEGDEIIRSATELDEAGIRFKKSKSESLKDITFKGGVLRLPLITVDDMTESVFLNLIAFERFHVGAGNEVTSYIFFMDSIIDSAMDASLLHYRGIIQTAIGSDEAIANLFNSLSIDITLDPDSSLNVVKNQVNKYCEKRWNKWRANLMHTYFTNPWAILSVIAAIFLFALATAQTIFTIYPYYHPAK